MIRAAKKVTNMQIRVFTIPLQDAERSEAEANKFLRSHRILQVERHFCPDGGGYWTLLVEYLAGDPTAEAPPASRKDRRDPSVELSDEEHRRYDHFKGIRKSIAKELSIPAYLVFTNEELALLSKMPELTEENTRQVKGIAPQRLADYVKYFISEQHGEAGGQPDGADSEPGEFA